VTISVTADAAFAPPRNQIDVSVPAGNVMTSVNVWRNDSFGRTLVRSQPSAGFESRTVYDYECPYGQNVTYDWAAEYYDPTDVTTTFSEPFSSWPGSWTGDTGSGGVASNRLTLTASPGRVTRAGLSAAWDVLKVASFSQVGSASAILSIFGASSNFAIGISLGSSVLWYGIPPSIFAPTLTTATTIDASQPITVTRTASGYLISGTGGTATVTATVPATVTSFDFTVGLGTSGTIGAITLETLDSPLTDLAETSSAVNLNPADAWLIAPQAPALSVPLSNSDQQATGIRELNAVNNGSNTTIHRILATPTPITTTTGNRQSDTLGMTLYTHTSDERQAVRALLAPDTPILINVPTSWDLDLAYGFYQVGDVSESRPYTLGGVPMRDFTLPLTQVRSPEVDVENPGWSYAQVATVWATYTAVLGGYSTYADLAADNRL